MLEPVGPLPPSVYWRRRAVAVVVTVLALSLGVWGFGAALTADGSTDGSTDAAPTSAPTASSAPPSPVASQSALAAPPPGAAVPGTAVPGVAVPGTVAAVPGGAAVPTTSAAPGAATPPLLGAGSTDPHRPGPSAGVLPMTAGVVPLTAGVVPPSAGPTPPVAVSPTPAAAPTPCADSALKVAARTDAPRYGAGDRPVFSLVVTNTGTAPCTRDLGPARTAMAVVRKPGDGLWGSDDCAPGGDPDVRTLAPGREQALSVRWAGRTSAPGCAGNRAAVPAGRYQLLTRLDGMVSAPATFTIGS